MRESETLQIGPGAKLLGVAFVGVALTLAQAIDGQATGQAVNAKAPLRDHKATEAQTQYQSWFVPDCAVITNGSAGSANQARNAQDRSAHGAAIHAYVDDSVEELKKTVPVLHGVKFDEGATAADSAAANRTASILDKTSAVTAEMMQRIPNLIAKEDVQQAIANSGQRYVRLGGSWPQSAGEPVNGTALHNSVYNYRIVHKGNASLDEALDEFRTDRHDHVISDPDSDPDSPRSLGFATSWLFFVPDNLKESRFRYLGEQKIGNYETYVVAFAQIPGHTHMDTVVHTPSGGCSTYSQGLAWIDKTTYRIVREQTDLLYPITSVELDQLRSVLNYGEVKIKKLGLTLWLPSEVETSWVSGQRTEDELHQYSDYRLFVSTVTILPPDQTSPQ